MFSFALRATPHTSHDLQKLTKNKLPVLQASKNKIDHYRLGAVSFSDINHFCFTSVLFTVAAIGNCFTVYYRNPKYLSILLSLFNLK